MANARATANLDELTRHPRHSEIGPQVTREVFEPERAVRKRNRPAVAAMAPHMAPRPAITAPATVTPAFGGFPALLDNFHIIPPDTNGAVGPSHVVTMLNSQVLIQSRTGVLRANYPMT